jgi:uncharacterized repeat protein (TIGR01451 family)
MQPTHLVKWCAALALAISASLSALAASPVSAAAPHPAPATPPVQRVHGPPGFALVRQDAHAAPTQTPITGSYTHTPAVNSSQNLPPKSGSIMPTTTIYYDFWLGTGGASFEGTAAGDTSFENLLTRFAQDLGGTAYHNIVTQYYGNNGGSTTYISNTVTFGGSWVDTTNAYPHAGTQADPLTDGDVTAEAARAVAANGWTEDLSHIVAVFTGNNIEECDGDPTNSGTNCTFKGPNPFCAYHNHFSDNSNDAIYAYMSDDAFGHLKAGDCLANSPYPNGDSTADSEINTFSHELTEAETDPHPNDTWTGSNGEIGDACNFNFAPQNDLGADVYLNGHPYEVQQEWSNAASTCAIDLPTNGFCAGAVSNVCAPVTAYTKSVDNAAPQVESTITYTLTLNNASDTGAETNLTVTDPLPAGYTVSAYSAPGSTTSSTTSTSVTVQYDTLPVHQQRTITIYAVVPVQAGTTATNCGSLSGSDLIGTALAGQTTNPCATTTPVKIPTTLTYNGATSGDYHDAATLSATLTDAASNPVTGKTITFSLNGSEACSDATDATGTASCSVTPGESAAAYTVSAAFADTTDPVYQVSSTTTTFTVTKEETTITYTGPTVILAGSGSATLTAKLVEDGANDNDSDGGSPAPVPTQTVTLSVGSQSCTGTTDASGNVTCTIPSVSVPLGPETVGASFAGDSYYQPSSASTSAIVFAFPSNGAFAVGNVTAATAGTSTVTWWGDTWWQLNHLSGGLAPSSFKGFAGNISLPTSTTPGMSCSGTWTTTGGNSPPPVSGVPTYMGVLVTSSVTKSGSTISGNYVHIVVVKVNPGYQPQPMFYGTGTIVATYC